MDIQLIAVIATEHETKIFYTDENGQRRAFPLDAVRHGKHIDRVIDRWIQSDIDRRHEQIDREGANELRKASRIGFQ